MSASRESANMWWWLFSRHKYAGGLKFFRRKMWRNPFFWQDSFITPWNRIIGCKMRGHRHATPMSQELDGMRAFCFNCYRPVKSYEFSKDVKDDATE